MITKGIFRHQQVKISTKMLRQLKINQISAIFETPLHFLQIRRQKITKFNGNEP